MIKNHSDSLMDDFQWGQCLEPNVTFPSCGGHGESSTEQGQFVTLAGTLQLSVGPDQSTVTVALCSGHGAQEQGCCSWLKASARTMTRKRRRKQAAELRLGPCDWWSVRTSEGGRTESGRDLGPCTGGLAVVLRQVSPEATGHKETIRDWKQLRSSAGGANYEQSNTKCHKPTKLSDALRAKAGSYPWYVQTALPRRWADHLSHPCSLPAYPPLPAPHLRDQHAFLGECEQGHLLFIFSPFAAAWVPMKHCLSSSSGLLSISID